MNANKDQIGDAAAQCTVIKLAYDAVLPIRGNSRPTHVKPRAKTMIS